jgi:hypothetical protein
LFADKLVGLLSIIKELTRVIRVILKKKLIFVLSVCPFSPIITWKKYLFYSGIDMQRNLRQLVLTKGDEKYVFRYEPGCEDLLLDALVGSAKDNKTNFDWFDAAVLSFKLTQSLITEADKLLNDKAPQMIEPKD